ncbi:hypothetical protein GCM10023089_00730 [Quisquiliibacterium transsilvanicum]
MPARQDHQAQQDEERRAMELVAGLAVIGAVSIVGLGIAAFADQLTGLDFVARALAVLGGL